MKAILDIKDSEPAFVMGLLEKLPFVKTKPLTNFQEKVLDETRDAIAEMHLIKRGKLVPRDAEDLFSER